MPLPATANAPFDVGFFPQHLALVTVGDNMLPMGYWTTISKNPFRMLICMGVGNHSLALLRRHREAALHLMPWRERERVVRAGHLSGRDVNKAAALGFALGPAERLAATRIVEGADAVFELVVHREITQVSAEYAPFVMDVVAARTRMPPKYRQPILYLSHDDFANLGERWIYAKG